jgi:peptidyl-prolyl cis-trans isomerase B (cyclophilin B)
LLAALALALVAGCGDDDEGGGGGSSAPADTQTEASSAEGGCKDVEQPAPRDGGNAKKPSGKLDPAKRYDVTLRTSCGDMTVRLDVKASPNATSSFVALARSGFFDDTIFHRIVPGFVIQGGDPTASGSGGPGYSTVDKPPSGTTYKKGVVAMAKAVPEPRGTAGSQFYVVTGEDVQLPPDYAVLGKVVKGLDVADRIGELGDPASGQMGTPLQSVVIESARVDVGS